MKSWLKKVLVKILGSQVRRLRRRNDFKIIGVAGSIGKTSTKLAIAKILQAKYRVRYQEGNYNDLVSVPFVFFGQTVPAVWNILAWLKVLIINEIKVWSHYPFDFVVVELGTDGPGQISQFRDYLSLDVAVLTAITPEHMQFFENIEAVATEEWSISFFSDWVLVNKDLCLITPENIDHKKIVFYGTEFGSVYKIQKIARAGDNLEFEIYFEDKSILNIAYSAISEVELYSITAAIILALKFKMASGEVVGALKNIFSFAGRMQRLVGRLSTKS